MLAFLYTCMASYSILIKRQSSYDSHDVPVDVELSHSPPAVDTRLRTWVSTWIPGSSPHQELWCGQPEEVTAGNRVGMVCPGP